MAVNYSINKSKEPEDNMRYAERKAERMLTNGLNNQPSNDNLLKREKKDFETGIMILKEIATQL